MLAYVTVCNNVRGLARLRNAQQILRLFGFYVLQIQQAGIRNEVRLRLVHQLYYGRVRAYAFAHKANAYPLRMAHGYERVHIMLQLFCVNYYAWVHVFSPLYAQRMLHKCKRRVRIMPAEHAERRHNIIVVKQRPKLAGLGIKHHSRCVAVRQRAQELFPVRQPCQRTARAYYCPHGSQVLALRHGTASARRINVSEGARVALKRHKPRLLTEPLRQLKLLRAFRYGQIVCHHRIHIYAKLRAQRIRAYALNKVFCAFFVATHTDKKHIHNHIIWNSTTLDCKHKFRDFLGSGRAVARLSDAICTEHRLSVIADPKRGKNHYGKWLGNKAKPSHRELLCGLIDAALLQKPDGFDALLKLLRDAGCEVRRRGNTLSLRHPDKKGFVRLSSIDGYTEGDLRAVLAGEKEHTPRKKRTQATRKKNTLLIDIEAKLQAGKGGGYERWAKVFNVKQMAQTYNYLREHGLLDYGELEEKASAATEQFHALSAQIKAAETRMAEIAVLKTHIANYAKTRDVYAGYRKAGYSKKYLAEHESDILLHKAAKNAFDELGVKKLPTVKSLQEEYAKLLAEKKAAYAEYRRSRDEMRELLLHKQNVDRMLGKNEREEEKKKEHDRQ